MVTCCIDVNQLPNAPPMAGMGGPPHHPQQQQQGMMPNRPNRGDDRWGPSPGGPHGGPHGGPPPPPEYGMHARGGPSDRMGHGGAMPDRSAHNMPHPRGPAHPAGPAHRVSGSPPRKSARRDRSPPREQRRGGKDAHQPRRRSPSPRKQHDHVRSREDRDVDRTERVRAERQASVMSTESKREEKRERSARGASTAESGRVSASGGAAESVLGTGKSPSSRRRKRVIPRYAVMAPRFSCDRSLLSLADYRQRYSNLYVPSDFFSSELSWSTSFPVHRPFSLAHPCRFTVMNRDVDHLTPVDATLEPTDIDYRFSAKVMLFSGMEQQQFFKRVLSMRVEGVVDEELDPSQATKNIQFLVGNRSKGEVMAIGGAWSPSLDGANPESDPMVLIRTAIRTTKALTGVDLSGCTQWYKFVELRYRRIDKEAALDATEEVDTFDEATAVKSDLDTTSNARVDTVVIYMPDIWSLMPTQSEHDSNVVALKAALDTKLAALDAEYAAAQAPPPPTTTVPTLTTDSKLNDTSSSAEKTVEAANTTVPPATTETAAPQESKEESVADVSATSDDLDSSGIAVKIHWSNLNITTMKVAELREQLEARGQDKRGLKQVLAKRLEEAIEKEKLDNPKDESAAPDEPMPDAGEFTVRDEVKEEDASGKPDGQVVEEPKPAAAKAESDVAVIEVKPEETPQEKAVREREEKRNKEKLEREYKEKKAALEKHYTLKNPAEPSLLVFPSSDAKGGKFDCRLASLHSLLDYRIEDNKEHSFEVSVFAEAFNQMLQRDTAFTIYKVLLTAQDRDSYDKSEAEQKTVYEAQWRAEQEEKANAEKEKTEEKPVENGAVDETKDKDDDVKVVAEVSPSDDVKIVAEVPKVEYKPPATVPIVKYPEIMFAFVFWDYNMCGYITERDTEEILYTAGLHLSRSQVSKIVRPHSHHDRLNYMRFCQLVVFKDDHSKVFISHKWNPLPVPLEALGKGNGDLLVGNESTATTKSGPPAEASSVVFEGSVVDIAGTLQKVRRLEEQTVNTETRNAALHKELASTRKQRDALTKKKRTLEDDVNKLKRKLHDAEKCLKSSKDDTVVMKRCLEDCRKMSEEIASKVEKVLPSMVKKKDASTDMVPEKSTADDDEAASASKDNTAESKDDTGVATPDAVNSGDVLMQDDLVVADAVEGDEPALSGAPADPTQKV